MTDFPRLLTALVDAHVRFIVVGGAAATAHGSVRLTLDLDIVYERSKENLERIVAALSPHKPYLRNAPPGLPFVFDAETLRHGLNFTLTTAVGEVDLLGEIAGGGTYPALEAHAVTMQLFGRTCRVLGLDRLIEAKRAAGRVKDLEAIAELEAIRDERTGD